MFLLSMLIELALRLQRSVTVPERIAMIVYVSVCVYIEALS